MSPIKRFIALNIWNSFEKKGSNVKCIEPIDIDDYFDFSNEIKKLFLHDQLNNICILDIIVMYLKWSSMYIYLCSSLFGGQGRGGGKVMGGGREVQVQKNT